MIKNVKLQGLLVPSRHQNQNQGGIYHVYVILLTNQVCTWYTWCMWYTWHITMITTYILFP